MYNLNSCFWVKSSLILEYKSSKAVLSIYFSLTELFFSFAKLLNSIALTYFQLFSFLTIFWKLFTEGLVHVSVCLSVSFIEHFITKTMAKLTFSGCWQDFLIYRVKKQIFKILSVKKQTNKKTLNIIHQWTETKTSVLALSRHVDKIFII